MSNPLPAQGRDVLIVEDEEAIRSLLKLSFRSSGVGVWEVASGEKGVEVFRHHASAIGLVILNVNLPGMNGIQTAGELRGIRPDIALFFITGDPGSVLLAELTPFSPARVFDKPFSPLEVAREGMRLLGPPRE